MRLAGAPWSSPQLALGSSICKRNTWHEKLQFSIAHDREGPGQRPWHAGMQYLCWPISAQSAGTGAPPVAAVPALSHGCSAQGSCVCTTLSGALRQICAVSCLCCRDMSVLPVNAFRYLPEHPHRPSPHPCQQHRFRENGRPLGSCLLSALPFPCAGKQASSVHQWEQGSSTWTKAAFQPHSLLLLFLHFFSLLGHRFACLVRFFHLKCWYLFCYSAVPATARAASFFPRSNPFSRSCCLLGGFLYPLTADLVTVHLSKELLSRAPAARASYPLILFSSSCWVRGFFFQEGVSHSVGGSALLVHAPACAHRRSLQPEHREAPGPAHSVLGPTALPPTEQGLHLPRQGV